jgi:hypothetical protein
MQEKVRSDTARPTRAPVGVVCRSDNHALPVVPGTFWGMGKNPLFHRFLGQIYFLDDGKNCSSFHLTMEG